MTDAQIDFLLRKHGKGPTIDDIWWDIQAFVQSVKSTSLTYEKVIDLAKRHGTQDSDIIEFTKEELDDLAHAIIAEMNK